MGQLSNTTGTLQFNDKDSETGVLLGELLDLQIDNPGLEYPLLAWKPFTKTKENEQIRFDLYNSAL